MLHKSSNSSSILELIRDITSRRIPINESTMVPFKRVDSRAVQCLQSRYRVWWSPWIRQLPDQLQLKEASYNLKNHFFMQSQTKHFLDTNSNVLQTRGTTYNVNTINIEPRTAEIFKTIWNLKSTDAILKAKEITVRISNALNDEFLK